MKDVYKRQPLHSESEEAQAVTLKMSYNKGNQLTAMANGKDKITYSYDKNGSCLLYTSRCV